MRSPVRAIVYKTTNGSILAKKRRNFSHEEGILMKNDEPLEGDSLLYAFLDLWRSFMR